LTALLALFDLDGTLFLTHDPLSGRALVATLEQVYGVQVPADAPANVEHRGLTAKRIGRNVLRAAGVADSAVDERLDTWCAAFAERYLELLADADTSGWAPRPGAAEGLARLQAEGVRLGLVTGNPEPMARTRLDRLGLARFFRPAKARSAARQKSEARCSSSPGSGQETGRPPRPPRSATRPRTFRARRPPASARSPSARLALAIAPSSAARTRSSTTWTASFGRC
jgi:phosphoglycolate phosphatase-like HAD superfamily hydrolase